MKPSLLLVVIVLLLSHRSAAQVPVASKVLPKITFGIKLGADFQQLNGNDWTNTYNSGFTGGAYVALTKKRFGVQVEALASSAKSYFSNLVIVTNGWSLLSYTKMRRLNFPVLFEYKIVSHLWLQAGPQFSDLLSAINNQGADIKSDFKSTDIGAALGIQATLPLHFIISVRYVLGLTNIDNTAQSAVWNTHSIQITGGFRFL